MPVTNVTAPNGKVFAVTHPEGATTPEIIGYARALFHENPSAEDGSELYKRQALKNSASENMLAAFGGAFPKAIAVGVKQRLGRDSPGEVQDWQNQMRGLTATPSGMIGAVLGGAIPTAVGSMLPGGSTVIGSAIVGGADAMIKPVTEGQSLSGNMVQGAALNAAIPAALALGTTAKALTDPLRDSGRRQIAGRVIERFASDPRSLQTGNLRSVSGAIPTLAESTGDIGLANLQKTLQSKDPRGLIAQRLAENNAARVQTLQGLGGTDAQLAAAEVRRATIGGAAYKRAMSEGVDGGMADALRPQIEALLERSEIKNAVAQARDLAKSEGLAIDSIGSVPGLQYTKQALDDMIGALGPLEANKRRIWSQTSRDLKAVLDEIAPGVRRADKIYQRLSREPNRMEVARQIEADTTSALKDFNGEPNLYANQFARTLDKGATRQIKTATGLTQKTASEVFSKEQMDLLNGLRAEVERQAASQRPRIAGSPTAQYLAGQDIVSRIAGPLGVPQSFASSALAENFLARPASWALKSTEERLNELLLSGILTPGKAAALVDEAKPSLLTIKAGRALQKASPALQGLLSGGWPVLVDSRQ